MKKKYIILSFLFFTTFVFAQTEDVITNLNGPARLFVDGSNLYYSSLGQIDIVDLSDQSNPIINQFVDGYSFPVGMGIYQDDFYFAAFGLSKIVKFNVNDAEPNFIDVTNTGETPNGLVIYNDYLYYSDNNGGTIYKFDLNGSSIEAELIVSDYFGVTGLAIKDNFLYFSVAFDGAIYKIDLDNSNATPTEVVSGMVHPIGIKIYGDYLYVADRTIQVIRKVNLSVNPIQSEILSIPGGIFSPGDIDIYGDYLYILEADKLSRIELSTLSTVENTLTHPISLYPNPASNYIEFYNLKSKQQYCIYDLNGREIIKGTTYPNQKIDVSYLNSGSYFVKLKNEFNSFRLIKI